jgi:hypothetical protein
LVRSPHPRMYFGSLVESLLSCTFTIRVLQAMPGKGTSVAAAVASSVATSSPLRPGPVVVWQRCELECHGCRERLLIIAIQTYGDLVNFHPHLHALVTDGAFGPTGWFVAFPKVDLYILEHLFRQRVLQMLLRERRIDEPVIRKLLGWCHSGFSLDNAVRIGSDDNEGRRALSEYILRSPFSQEKLRYQAKTGSIIYLSKMHPVLKRNFEVFSACDWLAALTAHIPNAGEHLVRDYGWYSNVSRGKRRKAQGEATTAIVESSEISPSEAKRTWAGLIKQVYEVDPLVRSRCGSAMRIIACIEQPEAIVRPSRVASIQASSSKASGYPMAGAANLNVKKAANLNDGCCGDARPGGEAGAGGSAVTRGT